MNSDAQKRYSGTHSLYHIIGEQRPPVFLQRNIRHVLDAHESHLKAIRSSEFSRLSSELLNVGMQTRSWQIPTTQTLDEIFRRDAPLLVIHPKCLIKHGVGLCPKKEQDIKPSWLPDPNEFHFRCKMTCSISEPDHSDNGSSQPRVLFCDARLVKLIGTKDNKDNIYFKIDMDEPFLVDYKKVLMTLGTGLNSNGVKGWERTALTNAVLRIGINCFHAEDAIQLISKIDPKVDPGQLQPHETELRATWSELPDCPSRHLPLRRYDSANRENRRTKKLDFVLDANMAWTSKPHDTALVMNNRALLRLRPPKQPMDSGFPPKLKTYRILYFHQGVGPLKTNVVRTDLRCIFCSSRLPHPSFEGLHFHYLTNHDHFSFRISDRPQQDPLAVEKWIYLDLAEAKYERASNSVSDEREITWIRPAQPFDLQKYLIEGGIKSWASGKPSNLRPGIARIKSSFSNGKAMSPVGSESGRYRATKRDRALISSSAPENVRALPTKKRKRFTVPDIPGVTVFRATSKRKVEPGELLSESDDDIEQFLLQREQIDRPLTNLPKAAREFATLYDVHIQREDISGNYFLGDSIVRFTRMHADQLAKPEMFSSFRTKLDELRRAGLISESFERYGLDVVEGKAAGSELALRGVNNRPHSNGDSRGRNNLGTLNNIQDGDGDVSMSNRPEHDRVVDDSDAEIGASVSPALPSKQPMVAGEDTTMEDVRLLAPPAGFCVCGQRVLGVRGIIACSNLQCPQMTERHVECVGLSGRLPGWLCPDCAPNTR